jgi:hypothetical protein
MPYKIDKFQLHVYSETRKRRTFVGSLKWDRKKMSIFLNMILNTLNQKQLFLLGKNWIYSKKFISQKPNYFLRLPTEFRPKKIPPIRIIVYLKASLSMKQTPLFYSYRSEKEDLQHLSSNLSASMNLTIWMQKIFEKV